MQVKLFAFAGLRELLDAEEMTLDLEAGAQVGQAIEQLVQAFPAIETIRPSLRAAINEEYAELDAVLYEGAQLALFPPVGGG